MDIKQYLANKFLETASIELIKQTIVDDKSLSQTTKKDFYIYNKYDIYCKEYGRFM